MPTETTSHIGWLRRRYLAMFSNRSLARKTELLAKKFGFGIVGFVKKSGFYVLGLILLATIFLAFLKGFDIWIYNKDRPRGAVIDNELDQTTMRTFEHYPFSTLHIQSYAHTKGWNGVGHITQRDEKFDFRSGDHGFFVDIDIDHPPTKEPNEYRIILTGGSGAQGFGGTTNDRMLYRRLEAELNKIIKATNGDTKVRVINLAMGGTVSYHNFIALNKWGHKLLPDMIISFSGHNEIAVPKQTGDDSGYSAAGTGAMFMRQQYPRSPDWLKNLAKVFPGLVHRTSLGTIARLFSHTHFSVIWRYRYWLSRYDPEYRGQYNNSDAALRYRQLVSKFDVRTEVINPWYIHAIESMRRDFAHIPFVLALQPLHQINEEYDLLRNEMQAVFDNRKKEDIYYIDVHDYWEENEYFKGSLVDSVHLSDKGHILASKFLSGHLTPIILKDRSPKN